MLKYFVFFLLSLLPLNLLLRLSIKTKHTHIHTYSHRASQILVVTMSVVICTLRLFCLGYFFLLYVSILTFYISLFKHIEVEGMLWSWIFLLCIFPPIFGVYMCRCARNDFYSLIKCCQIKQKCSEKRTLQVVLVVKNPPADVWDMRHRFDPWDRKISWRREWQPTPVFMPGESHGQRSLVGYSP